MSPMMAETMTVDGRWQFTGETVPAYDNGTVSLSSYWFL